MTEADIDTMHDGYIHSIEKRTIQVLDRIYGVTESKIRMEGKLCQYIDVATHSSRGSSEQKERPDKIDFHWNLRRSKRGNDHQQVHQGDDRLMIGGNTYFFRTLADGPIMVIQRNRHRYDASEEIILTREEMMEYFCREGVHAPWMVLNHPRLFPFSMRLPHGEVMRDNNRLNNACQTIGSIFQDLASELPVEQERIEDAIITGHNVATDFRYLCLPVSAGVFVREHIIHSHALINRFFFECGLVLVRAVDNATARENEYQGIQGDLYHDLKLFVDRQSIFNKDIDNGWRGYITRYSWLGK